MEDVEDARDLVDQRMRATGFEQDILDKVMDLLERFDTDREKLFEEMLSKLEQPGYDGLHDRWATNCEQAKALMSRLVEDMRSLLKDSEANAMSVDERWTAVGPHDFLAGEHKIWDQVAQLDVPDAARLISKILEADIGIIKKCEEDLKNARNNDAIVEQILIKNFGSIIDTAKSLFAIYAPTAGFRLFALLMKNPNDKQAATEGITAMFEKPTKENLEAAKLKNAGRRMVLDNIKLLTDAREQLDEEWIDRVFVRGAEAAGSWRGTGAGGDYRATDWDWMTDNVIDRGLETRAEAAKEQSAYLYDELFPTLIAESKNAFAQLTDNPDTLDEFNEELESTLGSLDDLAEAEKAFAARVSDSPEMRAAWDSLQRIKDAITTSFKMLIEKTKEADDEVKKE